MKIEPISAAPDELAQFQTRLNQSERTLIAEAQRTILHSGRAMVAHCSAVAGPDGAKFADEFCNLVLWSRMSPETWPIPRLLALLARTSPASGPGPETPLPREAFRRIAGDIERLRALRVLCETVENEYVRHRENRRVRLVEKPDNQT